MARYQTARPGSAFPIVSLYEEFPPETYDFKLLEHSDLEFVAFQLGRRCQNLTPSELLFGHATPAKVVEAKRLSPSAGSIAEDRQDISKSYVIQAEAARFVLPLKGKTRKNFVFIRCGSSPLFEKYFQSGLPRNWDVMLSYYDTPRDGYNHGADYVVIGGTSKFTSFYDIYVENPGVIEQYDAFLFLDDDIDIIMDDIDRLFEIFSEYGLWLAQPSLSSDSFCNWRITYSSSEYLIRYTSFVEVMMPVFSRTAIRSVIETFRESVSSWGLDYIWPKLLGYPKDKIAIVDAVVARHTQKIDTKGGKFYEYLAKLGVDPFEESKSLQRKFEVPSEFIGNHRCYGGVLLTDVGAENPKTFASE